MWSLRCMTVTSRCKTDSGDLPRCDGNRLAQNVSGRGRSMCPQVHLRGFSLFPISHGLLEWTLATYACCSNGNGHPPIPHNSWSTSVPPKSNSITNPLDMSIKQAPWKEQKSRRFLWNRLVIHALGAAPCCTEFKLAPFLGFWLPEPAIRHLTGGPGKVGVNQIPDVTEVSPRWLWTYVSGAMTRLFPHILHVCTTGRTGAEAPSTELLSAPLTREDGHVVLLVPSNGGSLPDGQVEKGRPRQRYRE